MNLKQKRRLEYINLLLNIFLIMSIVMIGLIAVLEIPATMDFAIDHWDADKGKYVKYLEKWHIFRYAFLQFGNAIWIAAIYTTTEVIRLILTYFANNTKTHG